MKVRGAGQALSIHVEQRGGLWRWKLLNPFGGLVDQSGFMYRGKRKVLDAGSVALKESGRGIQRPR